MFPFLIVIRLRVASPTTFSLKIHIWTPVLLGPPGGRNLNAIYPSAKIYLLWILDLKYQIGLTVVSSGFKIDGFGKFSDRHGFQ